MCVFACQIKKRPAEKKKTGNFVTNGFDLCQKKEKKKPNSELNTFDLFSQIRKKAYFSIHETPESGMILSVCYFIVYYIDFFYRNVFVSVGEIGTSPRK